MPRKKKPDTSLRQLKVVEDPAAIRMLFSEKYAEVLRLVGPEELSVSDVARRLGANTGSIYYRMKELAKCGLVALVREEIDGGVVKKYYRKTAVNFTVNLANPESAVAAAGMGINEKFKEKLIASLHYFGYDILPGAMEKAKKDLMAWDERSKAIVKTLQQSGLENEESDQLLVANTYEVAVFLRLLEDPQFIRLVKKFRGHFRRTGS
ncbi:MAG TPA: helix-turn-helix domain-containing protein [Methanoregula sp.]|nr:helix-turn-helix domain-containing protein [Methanoregula sp.]